MLFPYKLFYLKTIKTREEFIDIRKYLSKRPQIQKETHISILKYDKYQSIYIQFLIPYDTNCIQTYVREAPVIFIKTVDLSKFFRQKRRPSASNQLAAFRVVRIIRKVRELLH